MARLTNLGARLATLDTRTALPAPKVADQFYSSDEWRKARSRALARAGYKCCVCGRSDGRLFVDHIVERQDGGAEFDQSNLQVLCGSHHTLKTNKVRADRMAK